MHQTQFEAIGTQWHIEIETSADEQPSALFEDIKSRIAIFEAIYSRFKPDSLVSRMSTPGEYELPADAEPMWRLYRELYRITKGAFTPLIGSLLSEAGYDATYSLTPKELHKPPAWDNAIEDAFPHIIVKQPVRFDFGSIGKGYMIDLVGEMIEAAGFKTYIINAGGDIRRRNENAQATRIALENPANFDEAIGVATVGNASLCGSSGSRRKWATFHHILDPRTLASPRHVLAAWVYAPTTIIADAIATCLFLVPVQELLPHFAFEYAILRPGNSLESSPGFPGEFFQT